MLLAERTFGLTGAFIKALVPAFAMAALTAAAATNGLLQDGQMISLSSDQYATLQSGRTITLDGLVLQLKVYPTNEEEMPWVYRLIDSSKITVLFISIVLIVHGSFRSLKVEQENQDLKEKSGASAEGQQADMPIISTYQAVLLPVGASFSLLIVFLYFDSLQLVFAICAAVLATASLTFLIMPVCKRLLTSCSSGQKMSLGCCGRYTAPEVVSFVVSFTIVTIWILTGHWILMDALGMSLCVAFIALVRLPSLKVSTLLLGGLVIYDVFWVFFSSHVFSTNVMVRVATQQADNPVGMLAKRLHLGGQFMRDAPKLALPGKLVFPSMHVAGTFSMLGLGDIVMPGLLLCFVLRYDLYKRKTAFVNAADTGLPLPSSYIQRLTYFHCSLVGYVLGLFTATVSSEVFRAAQPALLYLVPFTMLPLFVMAYLKGDLVKMWTEPFAAAVTPPRCLSV